MEAAPAKGPAARAGAIKARHLHRAAEHHRPAATSAGANAFEAQATADGIAFEWRFQGQLQGHRFGRVVAQGDAEVVFDAVVAVGGPGGAWVEGLQLGGLHLAAAEGAPLQAADRPGDRRPAHAQPVFARIAKAAAPDAAHLHPTHPRIHHPPLAAPRGGAVLPGAETPLQQGGPAGGGRRLLAPAEGRQGGQAHGARALQPQLQVAAVEQGIEAPHRQGQHDQGGGSAGAQGPAGGQLGAALASQQFGGHPAAGASPHRRSSLLHQGWQGQEWGAGLAWIHRLGEGRRASQQLQGYGSGTSGGGQHRQPQGGVEALRLARIDVVAEQVEAAV